MPTNPTDDVIERAERLLLEPIVNRMGAGERACQLVIDLVVELRASRARVADLEKGHEILAKIHAVWTYPNRGPASVRKSNYRDAEDVLAESRRRMAEDDARRARERVEGEQVAKVIEISLRQAAGGARD